MTVQLLTGDCRDILPTLPERSIQCCVTSPPYFNLRDYNVAGQIGLESTLAEYISEIVSVFREVRRVLKDDGTLWCNIGDSYAGSWGSQGHRSTPATISRNQITNHPKRASHTGTIRDAGLKPKDLMLVPARLAIALQDDGWYLRSAIVWHKPNPMPESVTDRPTSAYEHIFLLSKSARYFYDADAIREPLQDSSIARLIQNVEAQEGSHRANGGAKTNGTMKAVVRAREKNNGESAVDTKMRGYGSHCGTYLDGRNARNVWTIPTAGFSDWSTVERRVDVSPDDADDDTIRTTRPDCPVHGDLAGPAPMAGCDGHTGAYASHRSPGTDGCHVQAPLGGHVPTDQILGVGSADESSDSLHPAYAPAATVHSNGMSRTVRDPATTQPCMPCDETTDHTDDTSDRLESGVPHLDMRENSISSADSGDDRRQETADGIADRPSGDQSFAACTCSYHKIVTETISHFAVFPPEIPRRCILAGSREGDTILDPFAGAGTTLLVADRLGRNAVGVEVNPEYVAMAQRRITNDAPLFVELETA